MTLLGALRLDDRILLAGDTKLIFEKPGIDRMFVPGPKLFCPPGMPGIAWGFTGAQAVGLGFGRWLQQQTFADWEALESAAQSVLVELNGQGRTRALAARADGFQPVDVLVAGYFNGNGKLLWFDEEGGVTELPERHTFMGGAAVLAFSTWHACTLLLTDTDLHSRRTFEVVMSTAMQTAGMGETPQILELRRVAAPTRE